MCLMGLCPPSEEVQKIAVQYGIILPFYGSSEKRSAEQDSPEETDASTVPPFKRRRTDGEVSTNTDSSAKESERLVPEDDDEKDRSSVVDESPVQTQTSTNHRRKDEDAPLTKALTPIKRRIVVPSKTLKRETKLRRIRFILRNDVVVDRSFPTFSWVAL